MSITLEISARAQAELARQAHLAGRALETYAAALLEDAAHVPLSDASSGDEQASGTELVEACAKIRGLLTNDEIDTLLNRSHSFSRPVDFE